MCVVRYWLLVVVLGVDRCCSVFVGCWLLVVAFCCVAFWCVLFMCVVDSLCALVVARWLLRANCCVLFVEDLCGCCCTVLLVGCWV